ncbi:MAG: hypothetical protein QM538_06535 [Methylacidiphilales bacterium]|nr:hypothetical protein [Candidatus Methylacidiphilales bacterium]
MIEIYTDGSFLRINQNEKNGFGHGGWAFCVMEGVQVLYSKTGGESGNDFANGKMELVAVFQAILYSQNQSCKIHSDSSYIVNGFNDWKDGWLRSDFKKGKIKFAKIWREAFDLWNADTQKIAWVKSHIGVVGNEKADGLALKAAEEERLRWQKQFN